MLWPPACNEKWFVWVPDDFWAIPERRAPAVANATGRLEASRGMCRLEWTEDLPLSGLSVSLRAGGPGGCWGYLRVCLKMVYTTIPFAHFFSNIRRMMINHWAQGVPNFQRRFRSWPRADQETRIWRMCEKHGWFVLKVSDPYWKLVVIQRAQRSKSSREAPVKTLGSRPATCCWDDCRMFTCAL